MNSLDKSAPLHEVSEALDRLFSLPRPQNEDVRIIFTADYGEYGLCAVNTPHGVEIIIGTQTLN